MLIFYVFIAVKTLLSKKIIQNAYQKSKISLVKFEEEK